ncbi:tyrosine-type recombinase/integrase [Parasutterella excrementihominis]|uniref:tyrosine-type recombinase/integrase n=1 Tax=Parasutterella excrementihominis TaxID=487175 RepID=UPI0027BA2D22|nr:site-specific integrase [Parasutterella excrementihominis]
MAKVTAKNIFTLPEGRHSVAPNLNLRVRDGKRTYVLRYCIGGKRKDKHLGSADDLSLTEAKRLADKLRSELAEGKLPQTARDKLAEKLKEADAPTFEQYALEAIEKIATVRVWKNAKHRAQWFATVRAYAFPVLGKKKLSEIKREDVLAVLQPIWSTKTETASRVRGRLENIFSYAVTDGLMEFNPALWRGNLDRDLPPPSKIQVVEHHEAMPLEVLQEKISCFYPADTRTRQVILFTILTASRVGESVPARWDEIDWENRIWSVPPERRKDQKQYPHRVPLSDQAIELLNTVERKGEEIFCLKADDLGSRYSLAHLLQQMTGTTATMHGFRSTFRDWAAENGVPDTVAEKCLMHVTGNAVVQAYQRSDLLEQRREVMQAWADAVFAKLTH